MIIDGILGSEACDSAGEVLCVENADISDVDKGTFLLNWEHASDAKLGAQAIVGKVTYAKKIYSESDCDDDRQRMYWRQVKLAFIYGRCRLLDGAGHDNARAIAAIIRDGVANNEKIVCRFSVEGSTLEREGNQLKSSVLRRAAITVVPCNRTANSGLISDPNSPPGYKKDHLPKKDLLALEGTEKTESFDPRYAKLSAGFSVECNPVVDDLSKAITAGGGGGAPSTLVGGAALQREDLRSRLVKMSTIALSKLKSYKTEKFCKQEFSTQLKAELPEASDEFIEHFSNIAEDFHVKRKTLVKQEQIPPAPIAAVPPQNVNRLQSLSVDLAQALQQIRGPQPADISQHLPEVHSLEVKVGENSHQAGRFLVQNGQVTHLEDYHGLLGKIMPQGPMDEAAASRMYAMSSNPNLTLSRHHPDLSEDDDIQPDLEAQQATQGAPAPRPASVFSYQRAGMDQPHHLEVQGGSYLLDGNVLEQPEIETILQNVSSGTATIRYLRSGAADRVAKMERNLTELLAKTDTSDDERNSLQEALAAVRQGVAAGHIHPKHERTLTQHLYEDRMTPGLGNKAAAEEFLAKKKPGVYLQLDGNQFREINNNFGHAVGDSAIKSFGKAAREAMDEAVGRSSGKLFRNPEEQDIYRSGGDEFCAHVPTHEHATKFARLLSQKLQALPAIGGAHKMSMAFGIGLDAHSADAALYKAKEQKFHPGTTTPKYPTGQVPNIAHSHVPGFEGPIPVHDEGAAATAHVMSHPDVSTPKMPKVSTPTPSAPPVPKAA